MSKSLNGLRVLLADDHAMVRLGFRLLLEGAGAQVLGEAERGEEAVRMFGELNPDVLVMDVSMPGIGGLVALERLIAGERAARVLMLSAHNDAVVPVRALKLGARGYLCKRAAPDEFLRAVGEVAADRRYIDPELAQTVALAQISGSSSPVDVLTEKELAVFMRLALVAAVSAGVSLSVIGVYLVTRRVVFLGLVLANAATAGGALARKPRSPPPVQTD